MEIITDEQIIRWIQSREHIEHGFRCLMKKYQEKLYWHVRRMAENHDDANDIIQNTFVKVYRSFDSFKGKSKLYTWLYRIATNEAITFLNKRKRRAVHSIDDEMNTLENQMRADAFFDGQAANIKLQLALESLPPKQRIVFNMRYYDEMSYNDISDALETSVGALKASYHHAVRKIEDFIVKND